MEMLPIHRLQDWIISLDGSEKVNFRSFGLNALFPLSRTSLCFPFLHAAVRCWNPTTHVFCFGSQEMCPTLEEFQALMESHRDKEIMLQPCFGHAQALGRICGLTLHEARSLAHNGELGIPELISRFSPTGDKENLLWRSCRQHALCLCLLAHFLLATSHGGASIKLIEVAQCLKEGKSCIGLVLAETLTGLDAFHQRETTHFAGSPLLLQVWLMDKLKVIDACPEYSARAYSLRSQLVEFSSEGMWHDWMCSRSAVDIAWRAPWLNLAKMSYSMFRQPGIQLVGLTHCVFYFPLRFRRQFGHDQTCPEKGIKYPTSFPIRSSYLPRYLTAWCTREFLTPALNFSCILPNEYLAWLEDEEQIRPTLVVKTSMGTRKRQRLDA